jgi:phage terminase large subunit-like protein
MTAKTTAKPVPVISPPKKAGIRHTIEYNEDQKVARSLATSGDNKFLLYYGSSGSGKSFFILDLLITRANRAPGSRHAIFRLTRNSCEKTLFDKTLHEVLDKAWPGLKAQCQISLSDMTVTFPNGSKLFFDGLDENRMTKVLGDEFNSIWINECNEEGLSYSQVSTLLSRLRAKTATIDGSILKNKMFFDCNPQWFSDWEYKAFIEHVNPEDGDAMPRAEQWVSHKLRTIANMSNLQDDYIEGLEAGSAASRRRYLEGEWSDQNTNALFQENWFRDHRIPKAVQFKTPEETIAMLANQGIKLVRKTVAVDPATTANLKSDLSGITVQALSDGGHVYVLADYTDRLTPDAVCETVVRAYNDWKCDRIIMENNAGGLWLDATLKKHTNHVPKFLNANSTTGGKDVRAEPVSAQYERGNVHHVGTLKDLEQQMCDFGSPASRRKSPDRMDAVVWGITELLDLGHEKKIKRGGYVIPSPLRR